jgi:hypothetical protein
MAQATRTLNPLPLQDLEPHRFEDLVRQLAYDFRLWRSLEATGRAGSDEGMDIVGLERVPSLEPAETVDHSHSTDTEEDSQPDVRPVEQTRLWVFQCKREKSLGPAQVKSIVSDFFAGITDIPHAYVLAAACDFSLKARRAFREALAAHGVMEFYVWGKGEIEDMLLLPKNDHLLFAYFGISLRVRRASARSLVRARLSLKQRLEKVLGGLRHQVCEAVMIRDPNDEHYPYVGDRTAFAKAPRWGYFEFIKQEPADHLMFVMFKRYAYANWTTGEWDFLSGSLQRSIVSQNAVYGMEEESQRDEQQDIFEAYWELKVPEENRALLNQYRTIHYDRVLAVDELGDTHNAGPHLLVDYINGDPFDAGVYATITGFGFASTSAAIYPEGPDDPKRVTVFPDDVPDLREELRAERRRRYEQMDKGNK